jgi:hypothetical protein
VKHSYGGVLALEGSDGEANRRTDTAVPKSTKMATLLRAIRIGAVMISTPIAMVSKLAAGARRGPIAGTNGAIGFAGQDLGMAEDDCGRDVCNRARRPEHGPMTD